MVRKVGKAEKLLKNVSLADVVSAFPGVDITTSAGVLVEDIAYVLFDQTRHEPHLSITGHQLWRYAREVARRLNRDYLVIDREIGKPSYGQPHRNRI